MSDAPKICFHPDELTEILKLGTVIEELVVSFGKIEGINNILISSENANDAYMGKALGETIVYYQTMQTHLNSIVKFYHVAIQQAFASYAELQKADNTGAGG